MAKDFISDDEMEKLNPSHVPDFISDTDMEKHDSGINPIETYLKKALDTATMDHGPNIIAGVKTLGGTIGDYPKERDAQRQIIERGKAENGVASGLGTLTGVGGQIAGMALAPEVEGPAIVQKAVQAFPLASKIAKGFAVGEGMSALKNPGDVEGQTSGLQLSDRADNAMKDAPLNALFATAGGVVSHGIDKLAQNKNLETLKTLSPTADNIKDAESRGRTQELADWMKKNGIVDGFPDAKTIAQRAGDAKERAGRVIGDIFNKNSKEISSQEQRIAQRQYGLDLQDFQQKMKSWQKQLGEYNKSGGSAEQDILPFVDDGQRTSTKTEQVLLHGKDASIAAPEAVADYSHQMGLKPIPQRPGGVFNTPHGDDLLPYAQQMSLNNMSTQDMLNHGKQASIEGLNLVKNKYGTGQFNSVTGENGQLSMNLPPSNMPTPPTPPKFPDALSGYNKDSLVRTISRGREGEGHAAQAVADKVQNIIDEVKGNKGSEVLSLKDLHTVKQRVQDQIRNWKTALALDKNAGPMVDMYNGASKYFDTMMVDKLNQIDGRVGAELRIANRNFNLASNVNQMASDHYYSSEAASKGANLITDIVNNAAAPFRGKMPSALSTPNLNAKMANMGPGAQSAVQSTTQNGLPLSYQAIRGPQQLTPTQKAKMQSEQHLMMKGGQ